MRWLVLAAEVAWIIFCGYKMGSPDILDSIAWFGMFFMSILLSVPITVVAFSKVVEDSI